MLSPLWTSCWIRRETFHGKKRLERRMWCIYKVNRWDIDQLIIMMIEILIIIWMNSQQVESVHVCNMIHSVSHKLCPLWSDGCYIHVKKIEKKQKLLLWTGDIYIEVPSNMSLSVYVIASNKQYLQCNSYLALLYPYIFSNEEPWKTVY